MTKINLKQLMAQVFEQEPDKISNRAEINATAGWDSLAHVSLMVQLQGLGVDLDPMDIPSLTNYQAISDFLKDKGFEVSED